MEGKKVLVTGASGLLGSAMAMELARRNEVHGLARFMETRPGRQLSATASDVQGQLVGAGVKIIKKDILTEGLGDIPHDFDYVFHQLAWLGAESVDSPERAYGVNTYFVGKLMDACRSASGMVLGSTGAVYLHGHRRWDESGLIGPRSTYATSKFGGEVLGQFLSEQWGIPTCILRYHHPYGPGGGLVAQVARQVLSGEEIELGPSGSVPRYTPQYITDCIRLTIRAAEHCSVPARMINFGGEEEVSLRELAEMIAESAGVEPKLRETEDVPMFWVADVGLMMQLLGRPEVSLREGVQRVVAELQGHD